MPLSKAQGTPQKVSRKKWKSWRESVFCTYMAAVPMNSLQLAAVVVANFQAALKILKYRLMILDIKELLNNMHKSVVCAAL